MIKFIVVLALVVCASAGVPRRPQLDGRIVGGSPAQITDYPYQVSLRHSNSHVCGASIVNANWAVTAAHCVVGVSASSVSFRAGSSYHGSGGTVHAASTITIHPSYNSNTMDYDVAVVRVSTPFAVGSSGVATIGLQSAEVAVGSNAIVTGWGTTSEGGSIPSQLQTVTVPTVSDATCTSNYGSGAITARMICAGLAAGGKDACQGDSGGPLRVGSLLTGIVSWGYGCARPSYPGVYSKVAPLRSWIVSNTS